VVNFLAYIYFFFSDIRKGGKIRKFLFKACIIVNTIITPLASWSVERWVINKDIDSTIYGTFFLQMTYIQCFPAFMMLFNFNFFNDSAEESRLYKGVWNIEHWRLVLNCDDDQVKMMIRANAAVKQLREESNLNASQIHSLTDEFKLPITAKKQKKLALDQSMNSLLFVSTLNIDGEMIMP
jgi:hypothetical protein